MTSERVLYVGLASQPGAPVAAALLKLVRQGVMESGEFAYGRHYLNTPGAQPLNPLHMPLGAGVTPLGPSRLRDGGALPLTLRDALPDAWGRRVLEAQHGRELADADVLLLTNDDRIGAMVFGASLPLQPGEPVQPVQPVHSLQALADAAQALEAGREPSPEMKRLLQGGGSLGGARPKATFVHEGLRYMAKFPSRGDTHDVEVLEAGTTALARLCGITVADFFLQPLHRGHALVLRRFDRIGLFDGERRLHYLSASAVLDVPYESSDGSYVALAQALRQISADPVADLQQLFRRLVFNLAVDNSDDHIKNHGLLRDGDCWRLAPAFDLVMQLSNLGYQSLAIVPGRLESHMDRVREAAPQFGLSPAQAQALAEEVVDTVHTQAAWTLQAHGAGKPLVAQALACLQRQADLIGL
ncbi:MAG: type II toxin-antitoxin system HipA family toxin [Proteobacteria bacterium]|nr:type II toxin-antitoxin system HipA family toxin [Pseudomonadota bacterium]